MAHRESRISDKDLATAPGIKRKAGKKKGTKADKYVKTVKKAVKALPKRKKGVYGKK